MNLSLVPVNNGEGQEQNIFVEFVEHSMYSTLFLKKPIFYKQPGSVETRDYSCKLLKQSLKDCLFPIPKDEGVPMPYFPWGRHHALKYPEGFL